MAGLGYDAFDALTFDCYGTLIDWETGILAGLRRVLGPRGGVPPDGALLERYAAAEAALEVGPYRRYREILSGSLGELCTAHGVRPADQELQAFGGSVGDWPAFPDSPAALDWRNRTLTRANRIGNTSAVNRLSEDFVPDADGRGEER